MSDRPISEVTQETLEAPADRLGPLAYNSRILARALQEALDENEAYKRITTFLTADGDKQHDRAEQAEAQLTALQEAARDYLAKTTGVSWPNDSWVDRARKALAALLPETPSDA